MQHRGGERKLSVQEDVEARSENEQSRKPREQLIPTVPGDRRTLWRVSKRLKMMEKLKEILILIRKLGMKS
jgi:hypothetical protein